jgi:uncharacterized SAM-binding protein YcdF (DUF218 family)
VTPLYWLRLGVRWFVRVVAVFVVLSLIVLGVTVFRVWHVARQDHHPASDAIVVLGASQFDGRPSAVFRARLDHALALYRAGFAPRLVTLGGSRPGDRFTEAAAGRAYFRGHGVPADDVTAVQTGDDTVTSLRAAASVFRQRAWHTAILVTDPWHALRAGRIANDEGIEARTSPTRTGPVVHGRGTEVRYVGRETMAFLYYRMFHRPFESGPRAV